MRLKLTINGHNQIYASKDVRRILQLKSKTVNEIDAISNQNAILLMVGGQTPLSAFLSLQDIEKQLKDEIEGVSN